MDSHTSGDPAATAAGTGEMLPLTADDADAYDVPEDGHISLRAGRPLPSPADVEERAGGGGGEGGGGGDGPWRALRSTHAPPSGDAMRYEEHAVVSDPSCVRDEQSYSSVPSVRAMRQRWEASGQ